VGERTRGWLTALGDVYHAVRDDPLLLVPVALVVTVIMLAAYLLWGSV
jgi:hypothetical protein